MEIVSQWPPKDFRTELCGNLFTFGRMVDVYETTGKNIYITDGVDIIRINEDELIYLVSVSQVIEWKERKQVTIFF